MDILGDPIDDGAPAPEPDPHPMDLILTWIGFDQAPIRERIRTEGFESFEDLLAMKEKDIRDLADSYAARSPMAGSFLDCARRDT